MSIALLFWGLARSLKYTLPSIQKNVFDVLKENSYSFDIFFHTYSVESVYTNNRANEHIKLDNKEYMLLNADYVHIDDRDVTMERLNISGYRTHGDPWNTKFQSFDNFVLAFYSKHMVYHMMLDTGKKYKYVVFLRPDVKYVNSFPIHCFEGLDKNPWTVYVPNFSIYWRMNDRFAVTSPECAGCIGNIFETMLEDSKHIELHSEAYMYLKLRQKKVDVIYINNFLFHRVRANGHEVIDKCVVSKLQYEHDNIYPKVCIYTTAFNFKGKISFFDVKRCYKYVDFILFTDSADLIAECEKYYVKGVHITYSAREELRIRYEPDIYLSEYDTSIFMEPDVKIKNFDNFMKVYLTKRDTCIIGYYNESTPVKFKVPQIAQGLSLKSFNKYVVFVRNHSGLADISADFEENLDDVLDGDMIVNGADILLYSALVQKHKVKYLCYNFNSFFSK